MVTKKIFQMNAVLLNFLFIKESWKKKNQTIIRNASYAANHQQIRMISEIFSDNEDSKIKNSALYIPF